MALRALSEAGFSKNWFTAVQARATSQLNHLNPNSEPQLTFLWPHKPIPNLSLDTGLWLAERQITWPGYWPLIGQMVCHLKISPRQESPGDLRICLIVLILVKLLWRLVGTSHWQGLSEAGKWCRRLFIYSQPCSSLLGLGAFELEAYCIIACNDTLSSRPLKIRLLKTIKSQKDEVVSSACFPCLSPGQYDVNYIQSVNSGI